MPNQKRIKVKMKVETDRLVITPFKESDKMIWSLIDSNPLVRKYLPGIPTKEESFTYIDRSIISYDINGYGRYAVRIRNTEQLIGMCGFILEDYGIDFGYRFLPEYWGKGLGFEAASVVLDFGLEFIDPKNIFAMVLAENIASKRIIEKLDFSFVGKVNFDAYANVLKYAVEIPSD